MQQKSTGFLKLIILYKTIMGTTELILSAYFFNSYHNDPGAVFHTLAIDLGLNLDNFFVGGMVDRAGALDHDTVFGLLLILLSFGIFNLTEAYGLFIKRKWGEWLTICGTGAMIPFELYELGKKFSWLTVLIILVNSFIVYYLYKHKELFHSKKDRRAP